MKILELCDVKNVLGYSNIIKKMQFFSSMNTFELQSNL